ncbi:MAG: PAS domain-containing protein, partial [Verrucomicrobia bacterium]|nr:PAS domain-containing protein [Verrucomicrobiota bacterium]
MKPGFLDKLVERLDRLDPENLQRHFVGLVQERGLLETIFQSIQEGVIVIDDEGRMTYANRAAERMLGFTLD